MIVVDGAEPTSTTRSAVLPTARSLCLLVVVALAWRLLLAALTPVPSEDGVSYLWMAQRFAQGDWRAPLAEVFPPLLPLLMAPLSMLELGWPHGLRLVDAAGSFSPALSIHGSQCVLSVLGALSVLPIVRLSALLVGGDTRTTWLMAGLLAALPALPARYCGEIYTEPVFALALASAALAGVRGCYWRMGVWAGVGFWLRSEALLLPLAWVALRPRVAWRAALPAVGAVALLALLRGAAGHGFDPLPKLAFNLPKAAVGDDAWGASLWNGVLTLPSAWLEAFGVAGVLALLGLWRCRARLATRPLSLTLVLALVVVVAFAVRRRFLVAWWPLIVPFAAVALAGLGRRWQFGLTGAAVLVGVLAGLRTTDRDRLAEREVGAYLAAELQPGQSAVSDLTRVLYFAGLRPPPPRHLSADEIVAAATSPAVRFVVLGTRRPAAAAVRAALPQFRPAALPADLARLAAARGLEVRER